MEPRGAAGFFAKGLLYSMHGAPDDELQVAQDAFGRAFALDREFARARAFEGAVTVRRARAFEGAVTVRPEQRDTGLGYLREARELDNTDPVVANELAWALVDGGGRGEFVEAKQYLEPDRRDLGPAALDTLGWIHFKLDEYRAARSTLENARAMQEILGGRSVPVWQNIQYHLGKLYSEIGEEDRAREAFREVVEFHEKWPSNSTARYSVEARDYLNGQDEE